jgi:hypothetical protein
MREPRSWRRATIRHSPSSARRSRAEFRCQPEDLTGSLLAAGRMLKSLGPAAVCNPRRTIAVSVLVVVASFVAAPVLYSPSTGSPSTTSSRRRRR